MKAFLLVVGGIVAFNVVTVAGLAVSEIRDRRRRGLEVRYLETLWHVDRPHLPYSRRVERSLARGPFRPWGGKPVGIALVAVTIFAGTALASTGARRVATSVLATVAEGLGLQTDAPKISADGSEEHVPDAGARDPSGDVRRGPESSLYPPFAGHPGDATVGDTPVAAGTGSPATPPGSSVTPLEPPAAPSLTVVSPIQIDLTWTDVSGETEYRIQRSMAGGPWGQVGTTGAGVIAYSDTALQPGTTYAYRVVAAYPTGVAESGSVSATTGIAPPDATTLSATATSSTQVVLTWGDVATEASYRIERSPDGATGWTTVGTTSQDATTYTDDGLAAATTYSYRVVAINDGGSTESNVVQVTTQAETPAGTATDSPAA